MPMGFMRVNAVVTERLPGNIPLTRDLLKMLEPATTSSRTTTRSRPSGSRSSHSTSSSAGPLEAHPPRGIVAGWV